MKLMQRRVVGAGAHRSGWPRVVHALGDVASEGGLLLDDFVDASFSYRSINQPRAQPWVGVFHHPVSVASPLDQDTTRRLRHISEHPLWHASRQTLRGAVALCEEVAAELVAWLEVPVQSIWHPAERDVPRWNADVAVETRQLVQAGYFLRNTQLIFQIAPTGWRRVKICMDSRWYRARDADLREKCVRSELNRSSVEVLGQLENMAYDQLLAESVLVTELYGAAANNLIVECMTRGTPIVVNRLAAVEEYLGADYPLFYNDVAEIPTLLDPARLNAASALLMERSTRLPTFEQFAKRVRDFTDGLGTA